MVNHTIVVTISRLMMTRSKPAAKSFLISADSSLAAKPPIPASAAPSPMNTGMIKSDVRGCTNKSDVEV